MSERGPERNAPGQWQVVLRDNDPDRTDYLGHGETLAIAQANAYRHWWENNGDKRCDYAEAWVWDPRSCEWEERQLLRDPIRSEVQREADVADWKNDNFNHMW